MSEFTVRNAELDDAERMAEIIADGREQTYNLIPGSSEYWNLVTNWRGDRGAWTMMNYMEARGEWAGIGDIPRARVAADLGSGAIVGVMTTRRVLVHGEDGVNLDFIFVDPERQGEGVGHLLMDDLTAYAEGKPQSVEVRGDNLRARRLYEKYGFAVVVGAANSGYSLAGAIEMIKPAERPVA